MPADSYAQLVGLLRQQADLAAALHLLQWDQETFMPAGALESRARQIGALATVLHQQRTAPTFLQLVDELAADPRQLDADQLIDVRETKWRMDRQRRLDSDLVRERSVLHAEGHGVWIHARRDDNFALLAPLLERIVDVERRVAAAIDPARDPYDVLLEDYEPGMTVAELEPLLAQVRDGLLPLVERLRARLASRPLPSTVLCGDFPVEAQRGFNRVVAERIGFDFQVGRIDEAAHPFTMSIGDDVRLTTRYDAGDLRYALFSTLHEAGHGLYEQGLARAAWGLPRGESCSLGIHESQSRLWENRVGRAPGFWRYILPTARTSFPSLTDVSLEAILIAVNAAQPSLIRTEADEITYNLHIIVRFELERALIARSIEVADLPALWRERMRAYLGVVPETDREGVLQDVHWASGALGYFPTYTLGNVYAAQLTAAAEASLGPLDALLAAGEFGILLAWLRSHIHVHGQCWRAPLLIEHATGRPPSPGPLIEYLETKVRFLESV